MDGRDVGAQGGRPGGAGRGGAFPRPPYAQRRMERSAVRACIDASAPRSASAFRAEQPVHRAARAAGG
eukprot:302970-Pleurochrysis_carterae.AAC.1